MRALARGCHREILFRDSQENSSIFTDWQSLCVHPLEVVIPKFYLGTHKRMATSSQTDGPLVWVLGFLLWGTRKEKETEIGEGNVDLDVEGDR